MSQPNRFGGTCTTCGAYVPPQQGRAVRTAAGWNVRCTPHADAAPEPRAAPAARAAEQFEDLADAEIRLVGSPEQVHALRTALRVATGVVITSESAPSPRRDADDDRSAVYLRVRVQAPQLALSAHEIAEARTEAQW